MRILATALPPSGGDARVCGVDVVANPIEVQKAVGYLPENPALYPELRVSEQLRFVAQLHGLAGSQLTSAVDQAIEKCALQQVTKRLCGTLSKGFRQRVGLAQAIVHDPKVLILDEPTSGLDPSQIVEMRKLISSFGGGHTVLLSTHILPEAVQICPRVIVFAGGRLVDDVLLNQGHNEVNLEARFMQVVSGEALPVI